MSRGHFPALYGNIGTLAQLFSVCATVISILMENHLDSMRVDRDFVDMLDSFKKEFFQPNSET